MELMERRQQSRYIIGIALNGGISLIILVLLWALVLPKYDEIGATVENINAMQSRIESLKSGGVDAAGFEELLRESGRRKELSDDVFLDRPRLAKVLAKPAGVTSDYVAWTTEEAGRIDVLDDEIERNDRILGNIIPHYAPSIGTDSANPIRNQVNLESFVSYVEKNILAKYSLSSFAPIGIENIAFDAKKTSVVNIGSFRLTIDFTGRNTNIARFVEDMQKSGALTIREGKLAPGDATPMEKDNDQYSNLSNLLVTIPSLTLAKSLDKNNVENNGSVVLEFYVEGMNYQKVLLLRSALANRFDTLKKNIRDTADMCTKSTTPVCQDSAGNGAVSAIRNLSRSVGELQQTIDGLRRGTVIADINAELDSLLAIQSTIESMEKTYDRNKSTIKKIQDRLNRKTQ